VPARRTYENDRIRVHWEAARCIHTGICLHALPDVFDTSRRPWVEIDSAAAEEVADAVERCPTGALRYERVDGAEGEVPQRPTMVIPIPDGPLLMVGDLQVEDPDGEPIAHEARLTLCRCGMSRNQPFCDNSHLRESWRSGPSSEPNAEPPPPREGAHEEPTKVVPAADASLRLRGHIRICDEEGKVLAEAGKTALCRCGQSQNKPFCDMSHEEAGFCSNPPVVERDRLEAETPAAFTPNPKVPDPQVATDDA
jgi:CDGSH-type Zn-finger protein/uncharacterized Fe-S cluster protein YjdI